jgi:type VI secretion system protein ImpC
MDGTTWTPDFGSLDAARPAWAAKRPVRIALLGDFGAGAGAGRLDNSDTIAARKPLPVEFDTIEDALARLQPGLRVPVGAGGAAVDVPLSDLDSFHPDTLYREVELFRQLADLRKRLNNTTSFAKAAAEVARMAGGPRRRPAHRSRSRGASPAAGASRDDFARLVGRPSAALQAAGDVDALLRSIVAPFIVAAPDPQKAALLATVDAALADAMRALLHHPDFQTTESLWRGVDFLLRRLETGPSLQVHLIDLSAEEMAADLSAHQDLQQTGLHRLLVEKPSQDKAGGFTFIAGLYRFEASPPHAELLGRFAKVAAQAGAVLLTDIAIDAFTDRRKPPHPLVAQAFGALRSLPESAHLALLGPRFMLRHPYGARSDPISSFGFEEFTAAEGLAGMLWGHPALAALAVLAGQGGTPTVGDLPFHHFADAHGDRIALPCTERFISADAAAALARSGIAALVAHKGEPLLRLSGLAAVNGEAISAAGSGAKPARSGVVLSVGGKAAGGKAAAAAPAGAGGDSESSTDDAEAPSDDSSSDMDALLAGLGGADDQPAEALTDDTAASDTPAEEPAMDPDLEALLKSLG